VPNTAIEAATNATMPNSEKGERHEKDTAATVASTVARKPHGVNTRPLVQRPRKRRNRTANANIETAERTALKQPINTPNRNASGNGNTKQNATELGNATKKKSSIIVM
jgi:hypothetical protein